MCGVCVFLCRVCLDFNLSFKSTMFSVSNFCDVLRGDLQCFTKSVWVCRLNRHGGHSTLFPVVLGFVHCLEL